MVRVTRVSFPYGVTEISSNARAKGAAARGRRHGASRIATGGSTPLADTSLPSSPEPRRLQARGALRWSSLEVGGAPDAATVVSVEVAPGTYAHAHRDDRHHLRFGPQRQGDQGDEPLRPEHVVRRPMRWDAAAFELTPAQP